MPFQISLCYVVIDRYLGSCANPFPSPSYLFFVHTNTVFLPILKRLATSEKLNLYDAFIANIFLLKSSESVMLKIISITFLCEFGYILFFLSKTEV